MRNDAKGGCYRVSLKGIGIDKLYRKGDAGYSVMRKMSNLSKKQLSHCEKLTKNRKEAPYYARLKASFTLEASLIVPIVAIILVMVLFGFRMLQVQTCVESAAIAAAREAAVYSEVVGGSKADETKQNVISIALARKWLYETNCPTKYVLGEDMGISFLLTSAKGDYVKIAAIYQMKIPFSFFYNKTVLVRQTATARKWTGYDKSEFESDGDEDIFYSDILSACASIPICKLLDNCDDCFRYDSWYHRKYYFTQEILGGLNLTGNVC